LVLGWLPVSSLWSQGAIRSVRSGIFHGAILPFPLTGDHKDVVREEKGKGGKGLLEVPLKELPCAVSHDEQQEYDLNPGRDRLHRYHENLSRVSNRDQVRNQEPVLHPPFRRVSIMR